jgi:hypothetical protein
MKPIDYVVVEQLQKEARIARSREVFRILRKFFYWLRSLTQAGAAGYKSAPCC